MGAMNKTRGKDAASSSDIKWNFTKFVVDRSGNVIARYEPTNSMEELDRCIAGLI